MEKIKVMVTIFSLLAELERALVSEGAKVAFIQSESRQETGKRGTAAPFR